MAKSTGSKKTALKKAESKTVVSSTAKVSKKSAAQPRVADKERTYFYANGKRKTAVATVRLYTQGKGVITINKMPFEKYFPVFTDQDKLLSPLRLTNLQKLFDISVKVRGGGIHAQAEAVRHGIAKALLGYDVQLRSIVKSAGFLTRDSRVKERKKYGLKRARRAPQWQKR